MPMYALYCSRRALGTEIKRLCRRLKLLGKAIRARPDSGVKSELGHQLINKSPALSPSPLPLPSSTSLSFMLHRLALRNARVATLAATPQVFFTPARPATQNPLFFSTYFRSMSRPGHMLPPKPVCSESSRKTPICILTFLVAASEVSSILESRISGTSLSGNVEETGRVLS